jgi:alpha-1,2-mannosyltransferase
MIARLRTGAARAVATQRPIADGSPLGARVWEVDGRRLSRRCVLVAVPAFAITIFVLYVVAAKYTADFHWGIWTAGRDLLRGRSPYPPADPHLLLRHPNDFVTPPLLGLVGIPFSPVPFQVAVPIWNLVCVAALLVALRCVGVRDRRIYLLALASAPLIDSLETGQPDALFALAAAITWRYRDSWQGGVSAGILIAAKLLAWPLLIWLLVTRRFRTFWVAVPSAVGIFFASWAVIGLKGLAAYPSLLAADAKAFETWPFSYGLVQALTPLGLPIQQTRVLAVVIAVLISVAIVAISRRRDEGWFAAALTFGLLSSPVLWTHYLVVLFVPLALARRRQLTIWIGAAYSYWLLLILFAPGPNRALAALASTAMLAALAGWSWMQTTHDHVGAPLARPNGRGEPVVTPSIASPTWNAP